MTTFPPGPMASLVDAAVRFDLAESTGPPLRLDDVVDPAELAGLSLGYGTSRGDDGLRSLIAAGCGVGAEQVLVTVGAVEAMFLTAQDRCSPGGRVLVVGPCLPPARAVPEGLGSVDVVPMRFDDGYRLDVDAVADALTPTTRLVSLASPQNPSGVATRRGELRQLLAAVEERSPDAVVLVDETYRASTFGDANELRGPTSGVVRLPLRIHWSGPDPEGVEWDTGNADDRRWLYEVVLRDGDLDDVRRWVDGRSLVDLWDDLHLPPWLTEAWDDLVECARRDRQESR